MKTSTNFQKNATPANLIRINLKLIWRPLTIPHSLTISFSPPPLTNPAINPTPSWGANCADILYELKRAWRLVSQRTSRLRTEHQRLVHPADENNPSANNYQLYNDNEGSQSKAQFKILTCTSFFAFFIFSSQKFGMCAGYIYVWIKQARLHSDFTLFLLIIMVFTCTRQYAFRFLNRQCPWKYSQK